MAARGQTIASLDELVLSGLPQPTQAKALRYWFDDDAASVQSQPSRGNLSLDVSGLTDGFHTLHFQVVDENGQLAYVSSGMFLKMGVLTEASSSVRSLRFWYDDDAASVKTCAVSGSVYTLDVASLTDGLHTLHFQVVDENGQLAYVSSDVFLKVGVHTEASSSVRSLRFWYDDDAASVKTCAVSGSVYTLDVASLTDGLHTLHFQVVDENGQLAYVSSGVFLKMGVHTEASSSVRSLRFWYDDDASSVKTCAMSGSVYTLDVASLPDGLHTLHFQIVDENGQLAYVSSSVFLKTRSHTDAAPVTASKLVYWFDDETTFQTVAMNGGVQQIDASRLSDGLHTVHYLVQCSDGQLTMAASAVFLRMNIDTETSVASGLRYWFDDQQTATETKVTNGTLLLDAATLTDGLHTVHYQTMDNRGTLGAPASSVFLKMDADMASTMAKSVRYWFDDDAATMNTTTVAGGTQTLDVAALSMGLHTLNYQLIDSEGRVGIPVTRIFLKNFDKVIASEKNCVTKYQYWLNTNSQTKQIVELASADNPYTLIALLPMPKEPIHSDCFHFELTDGVPMVYAKNVFHIRFYDATNYFSEGDRTFVDYDVKQEVTDITLLQSGIRETTAKPAENAIKWYKVEAERGDSLQFKLDRAATIQLFAPSGEEVYNVSGAESVKWGGLHVWEDGTFYLALHDMTAQQGNTVSIDYNHIDKYAVLRQDVAVVGNGGCSTITFEGNGFRDLYAVDLYNAQGDTIKHSAICYSSDAEVSITFDFTHANLGAYHALFRFVTDEKRYLGMVRVEEAKDIELALDVKYPNTFLPGNATTYTITVTNKGNATAYRVPLQIGVQIFGSFTSINSIDIIDEKGNKVNIPTIQFEKDSIEKETLSFIEGELGRLNGLQSFIVAKDSLDGSSLGLTEQLVNIPPCGMIQVNVKILCGMSITLSARIPSEWVTINSSDNAMSRKRNSANDKSYCCWKDVTECSVGIVSEIAGLVPVLGCAAPIIDLSTYTVYEIACANGGSLKDKSKAFYNSLINNPKKKEALIDKGIGGLLGCVSGAVGKAIDKLRKNLKKVEEAKDAAKLAAKAARDAQDEAMGSYRYLNNKADEAFAAGNYESYEQYRKDAANALEQANKYGSEAVSFENKMLDLSAEADELTKKINEEKEQISKIIDAIKAGFKSLVSTPECVTTWKKALRDCSPAPKNAGGTSTPVRSYDPNEIYGYLAESGSNAVSAEKTDVYYTVQFENDTTFATASAHEIVVTDTLDATKFDLSTFAPTEVRIGDKSAELNGDKNFVTTIDMRPEINAIAQVEGTFNEQKGIAKWHITSLDPMTMEPTDDVMQGVLPVNYDGSGIGEVSYDISLKPDLAHGTEVKNRAAIVFDTNDVIMTPTWTNIIDRIAPESHITDVQLLNDSTATVSIEASDELSGPWRYDVFVQYGSGAWFKAAENVAVDTTANVKIYEGMEHHFYCVVTDSAGNVEQKAAEREFTLEVLGSQRGDVNKDGAVDIADVVAVYNIMAGTNPNGLNGDVNKDGATDIADVVAVYNIMAGGHVVNAVRSGQRPGRASRRSKQALLKERNRLL